MKPEEKLPPAPEEKLTSEENTPPTKAGSMAKVYFLWSLALMVCSVALMCTGGSGFIDLSPVVALPAAGISILLFFAGIHAMDEDS